jgi:hypothetical protein
MADPNVLIPADLNFNGYPDPSDKNYWDVKITGLKPNTGYGIQFQWVFEGGKLGLWSATRYILTNAVPAPGEPELSLSNVQGGQGVIKVTWSGKDSGGNTIPNVKRVNIHISGGKFGDGSTPADYFLEPGTKIIAAEAGVYMVQLKALAADEKTYSVFSQVRTVTVTGTSVIVETPTLPTGLSVSQSAFAVAVNWGGTYSGNNFEGFKSIDVHVSGSDLGATTTSGFSASTQVATLTVNSTTNRQNVGLDNLRVALGLASNNDAYTAPMFFYYIARNSKDELYSVNGNPTYTRINSTSVNPKKANLIDLENGLISIQNLVAGNGQFASWLRAGGDGGARIELSGTDTTTPSG